MQSVAYNQTSNLVINNEIFTPKPQKKDVVPQDLLAQNHYLSTILQKSQKYLIETFNNKELQAFHKRIEHIFTLSNTKEIIAEFEKTYYAFVKECYQSKYQYDTTLEHFLHSVNSSEPKSNAKIIWGDCLASLKRMKFVDEIIMR